MFPQYYANKSWTVQKYLLRVPFLFNLSWLILLVFRQLKVVNNDYIPMDAYLDEPQLHN